MSSSQRFMLGLIAVWVAICLSAYAYTFTDDFAQVVQEQSK